MYKICHYLQTLNIQFLIISIYKIFPINRDLIIYIKHDLTEHGIYIYITTCNCSSHKSNFFLLLVQPNFSDKEGLPLVVSDNLFRDIMQSTNFSSVTHDDGHYGPVI